MKTEFITSFGGDDEKGPKRKTKEKAKDDEDAEREPAVVQGPILPNKEYRRLL